MGGEGGSEGEGWGRRAAQAHVFEDIKELDAVCPKSLHLQTPAAKALSGVPALTTLSLRRGYLRGMGPLASHPAQYQLCASQQALLGDSAVENVGAH